MKVYILIEGYYSDQGSERAATYNTIVGLYKKPESLMRNADEYIHKRIKRFSTQWVNKGVATFNADINFNELIHDEHTYAILGKSETGDIQYTIYVQTMDLLE